MSPEMSIYLNMAGVLVISIIVMKVMLVMQKNKEAEADHKFQQTMELIELRNRKHKTQ